MKWIVEEGRGGISKVRSNPVASTQMAETGEISLELADLLTIILKN